jgi:hypothetical protein
VEEAASLPLVGLTAWQAPVERANLRSGAPTSSSNYRRQAFETVRHDHDVVLDTVGGATPGEVPAGTQAGRGSRQRRRPPDPTFAKELGANPVVRLAWLR